MNQQILKKINLKNSFAALKFAFINFGPLLIFYVFEHFWGLKPAIVASALYSMGEVGIRIYLGESITGLFKFTAIMTLVFGTVDLFAQKAFLFKYEAAVTNLVMAGFFGISLFAEKSMLLEYYHSQPNAKPLTRDRIAFFQIITAAWAIYFLVKAVIYFWFAQIYTIDQLMGWRAVLGTASMYVMLALSFVSGRKLFPWLKKKGWLPHEEFIQAVHHVQIMVPVGKEGAAREFYGGVLGLKEIPKPEPVKSRGGFWMQLSNTEVHISMEDGIDRTQTKAHVAYQVNDLEAVRALLIKNGLKPVDGTPIPGYARFDCRDPFGNRMEFIQSI